MAPKSAQKKTPQSDPNGIFSGMVVFLVEKGVQSRRLQVWRQKLVQMGAAIEDHISKRVTHVFAMNPEVLVQQVDHERLVHFKGSLLLYQWLEESLKEGEKISEDLYYLDAKALCSESIRGSHSNNDENNSKSCKKTRVSSEFSKVAKGSEYQCREEDTLKEESTNGKCSGSSSSSFDATRTSTGNVAGISNMDLSPLYNPPDLNRNITDIFAKLINIYRALGDDRRSFSYSKAIPVIEKLPFKIESVDQVKHLPAIGKSMQDHIQEIVTTGKLSKLEHFETDEKVCTISLFGEVWGVGPATALKLYEKGHRTLDDLKNEGSLTSSQRLGLKFFDDIKKRISRDEAKEMEILLQKSGEHILPGVIVTCGGSYRRGKATCGDLDIIITHPDGESHKGFLSRFVKYLKDIKFLREDLVFSTHSMEGTESGVDTYFGLCTFPGQEQRHRIDLKVYPRDIYAFGLIAWTGNDVLNRRLRLLADSKGYMLDDTGLYLFSKDSTGKKVSKANAGWHCKTEREVFDALGFPWLEPHERNL